MKCKGGICYNPCQFNSLITDLVLISNNSNTKSLVYIQSQITLTEGEGNVFLHFSHPLLHPAFSCKWNDLGRHRKTRSDGNDPGQAPGAM